MNAKLEKLDEKFQKLLEDKRSEGMNVQTTMGKQQTQHTQSIKRSEIENRLQALEQKQDNKLTEATETMSAAILHNVSKPLNLFQVRMEEVADKIVNNNQHSQLTSSQESLPYTQPNTITPSKGCNGEAVITTPAVNTSLRGVGTK